MQRKAKPCQEITASPPWFDARLMASVLTRLGKCPMIRQCIPDVVIQTPYHAEIVRLLHTIRGARYYPEWTAPAIDASLWPLFGDMPPPPRAACAAPPIKAWQIPLRSASLLVAALPQIERHAREATTARRNRVIIPADQRPRVPIGKPTVLAGREVVVTGFGKVFGEGKRQMCYAYLSS